MSETISSLKPTASLGRVYCAANKFFLACVQDPLATYGIEYFATQCVSRVNSPRRSSRLVGNIFDVNASGIFTLMGLMTGVISSSSGPSPHEAKTTTETASARAPGRLIEDFPNNVIMYCAPAGLTRRVYIIFPVTCHARGPSVFAHLEGALRVLAGLHRGRFTSGAK